MMRRGRVIPLQAAPPEATHGPGTGAGRWRAARLLDAPHRLSFFAAAVLMAGLALWWLMALTARWLGLALPWAVSPSLAHGLALALGFMPLFITGFAFTAGPRWLGLPEVSTHRLLRPVLAMVTGWGLAIPPDDGAVWANHRTIVQKDRAVFENHCAVRKDEGTVRDCRVRQIPVVS